jgi:hypothetical protein
MRRLIVGLFVVLVSSLAGVSAPAGATVKEGGSFICDGLTGCYITSSEIGAYLVDACTGDLETGPFRCRATRDIGLSTVDTVVYTRASCSIFHESAPFVFEETYEAEGTIIVHQVGSKLTLAANCPRNEL